jgi:hypothetical protein
MMPPWYGDMRTGDRVTMTFIDPPLVDNLVEGKSTTTVTGTFDRISMEPVDGYPWNAAPHACSIAVVDEEREVRAPITQIVSLNPVRATVPSTHPDPKGSE